MMFGLLYWLLDSGGPYARYVGERPFPDFAFTQQLSPELAPPGWRPKFVDYLILGLTTNTAFSPTDVMPLARWAKLTMALQSLNLVDGHRPRDRPCSQRLHVGRDQRRMTAVKLWTERPRCCRRELHAGHLLGRPARPPDVDVLGLS